MQSFFCRFGLTQVEAQLLRDAALILWDEAPSSHKHHVYVADRLLRDIMKAEDPAFERTLFGGKVFGLCGDFRQTLPVVKHGSRAQIVSACINSSTFWSRLKKFKLTHNMRVLSLAGDDALAQAEFADWCLKVGQDDIASAVEGPRRMIPIPPEMLSESTTKEQLYLEAFGQEPVRLADRDYMTSRSVVAAYNADVDDFNQVAHGLYPGEVSNLHVFLALQPVQLKFIDLARGGKRLACL